MGTRPPFVLVHGGRHGGWCWARVAPLLRAAGHDVYTPTLTGLGERSHLLSPHIGLATHIQDITAVFEYEEITDAVLVAHSYGGSVVAGVMEKEKMAEQVRCLVFLDAFMPRPGETVLDIVGADLTAALLETVERDGKGWFLPTTDASFYGVTEPADVAWVNTKMTPQPLKSYTDPSGPTGRIWSHPGLFVECRPTTLRPEIRQRARDRSLADPGFRYRLLDAPHDAMVTHPELVARLLSEAAGPDGPQGA
jgi:pimeloyl-ACP methyl ester carboxylesterase